MKYSETPQQEKSLWEKFITKSYVANFIIIGLVIYLGILLVRSIIGNYAINQEINRSRQEITDLEKSNQDLKEKIKYYQSDTFKEIEARAKLGYQKEGEKVIILPKSKKEIEEERKIDPLSDIDEDNLPPTPHYLEWWQIFFNS